MIKFLLNGTLHTVENLDPNTTVLDYLREHLRKTGTKEGCASGDCGACTVAVGEVLGDRIQYRNIMSCIALLPTMHGKHLVTVEGLKVGESLHRAQQSMVECHGSQCGYCTPGFVMSLFTLGENYDDPSRKDVETVLAGNLCRCTGYQPIINAAFDMYQKPADQHFSSSESSWMQQLQAILKEEGANLGADGRWFFAPRTTAELSQLLEEHPGARLLAGGTDLNLEITQLLKSFDAIIYLGAIDDLNVIEETNDSLILGAATTYADCVEILGEHYPDFAEIIERIGSSQIRNVGTIGGNVANASPIGDTPPALIALKAKLHLKKGDTIRVIGIEDFYLAYKVTAQQPGEFIYRIEIPKPQANDQFKMYKVSKRFDDDISAVCAAFNLSIQNGLVESVRIAYGGMSAVPKRAVHSEAALQGQNISESTINQAMAALGSDFQPIDDVRASAEYRNQVAQNLLMKCLVEIQQTGALTRVNHYE